MIFSIFYLGKEIYLWLNYVFLFAFILNVSYLHSLLYFLLSICLSFLFVPLFMHLLAFISFHNFISSFLFFSFLSSSPLF